MIVSKVRWAHVVNAENAKKRLHLDRACCVETWYHVFVEFSWNIVAVRWYRVYYINTHCLCRILSHRTVIHPSPNMASTWRWLRIQHVYCAIFTNSLCMTSNSTSNEMDAVQTALYNVIVSRGAKAGISLASIDKYTGHSWFRNESKYVKLNDSSFIDVVLRLDTHSWASATVCSQSSKTAPVTASYL